jgi:hypothetical protein
LVERKDPSAAAALRNVVIALASEVKLAAKGVKGGAAADPASAVNKPCMAVNIVFSAVLYAVPFTRACAAEVLPSNALGAIVTASLATGKTPDSGLIPGIATAPERPCLRVSPVPAASPFARHRPKSCSLNTSKTESPLAIGKVI